uniref:Succinate dehydrogenase assembly factor 2, mitochondrial n=1 Tax=Onchocerca volvulus TaxID=6282 RepID=A0A8R1U167_ONCVO
MILFGTIRQLCGKQKWFPQVLAQFSEDSSAKIPQTAYEYHPESRLENEKIETKRSRLLYQSKKRGILENDILLGEFADQMLQKMNLKQLMRYDEIINGEYMEWDLYYYISGRKNLPKDLEGCEVFQLMLDFVKKRTEEEMHVDNVLVVLSISLLSVLGMQTNPISIPKGQKHGNIVIAAVISTPLLPDGDNFGVCELEGFDLNPTGPLVPCNFLDERWIDCDAPIDISSIPEANNTKVDGACLTWGGTRYENVEQTNVTCRVLPCIECRGPRTFMRKVPCIKYTGHYFLSTLLYSVFLGILAVDRFCLGYSAIAVGKLMTLGGLGLWWIVDIILLITGNLLPADGSNWQPYY